VSSCNVGNSQTVKSPWSRLRQRVHEVTGRSRTGNTKNQSSKFGSLLKLANEERRFIHQGRRSNSQIRLNPIDVKSNFYHFFFFFFNFELTQI
jgi:hypothetical protein